MNSSLIDETNATADSNDTSRRTTYDDDVIAGACFFLTALWGLVGYLLVLPAIASSKKLRHQCYALIFSMGLSDVASLIAWLVVGIDTMTHGTSMPHIMLKHSLCVLVVGWGSLTVHIGVLGINRYLAICRTETHDWLFSRWRLRLIIGGCWTYAVFVHAFPTFLPPNMDFTLDGYAAYWESVIVSDYYFVEDISWCTCVFALDMACYAAIIAKYRQVRKQMVGMPTKAAADRRRQFRLAMQCLIRCCTFYIYDVLYYVIGFVTQNIWLTMICSTYLWDFNNAISPWLHLAFDRQLRTVIARKFWRRKTTVLLGTQAVSTVVRPLSTRHTSFVSHRAPNRVGPLLAPVD